MKTILLFHHSIFIALWTVHAPVLAVWAAATTTSTTSRKTGVTILVPSTAVILAAPTLMIHVGAIALLLLGILLNHVDHLVRDPQIFNGAAADIAFGHFPEFVAIFGCANNLSQVDIHPRVATDQVTVVCLAVLQLHKLE